MRPAIRQAWIPSRPIAVSCPSRNAIPDTTSAPEVAKAAQEPNGVTICDIWFVAAVAWSCTDLASGSSKTMTPPASAPAPTAVQAWLSFQWNGAKKRAFESS
jgi:hypothetical protein